MITFTGTATSEFVEYPFVTVQDRLSVTNNSFNDMQLEVGDLVNITIHAKQTWDNRVKYTSFKIKGNGEFSATIIDDTVDVEELGYKTVNISAQGNLTSGTVTAVGASSITDNTATWTVDEWADKVIKLVDAENAEDFCLVLSNTADTITFDCLPEGLTAISYEILDTYYAFNPQSIYALDIRTSSLGLVMPSVVDRKDRSYYKIYNEMANNGDFKSVVIFRGADRARTRKYFTLDHRFEAVDLYAHYWNVYHWDILNIDSVKRYASIRVNTSLLVGSATFAEIATFAFINHLQAKRFIAVERTGIYWLKYKSLVDTEMLITGALSVQKTGVGTASIVEITIRLKRDGIITDLTDLATVIRLPANDTKSVPMSIPIELQKDDEITLIAKRDNDTISILDGSTITISEL